MKKTQKQKKKYVYLDHASSTPVDPTILKKMYEVSKNIFANPSALHSLGLEAHTLVEQARTDIARTIDAHVNAIVFVSVGTETDNLATVGVLRAFQKKYPPIRPHIIASNIEHAAIFETLEFLKRKGEIDVSYALVNEKGILDPKTIRTLIKPETILVSVMYANNEIGTIQPISYIAKEVRHARRHKDAKSIISNTYPLFHIDASQAFNYLPMQVSKLGADLVTFNASKIYGPKGIGALYVKRGAPVMSQILGGDQEFGLRAGTVSPSLISGFSLAVMSADALREKETKRLIQLRDYFVQKLMILVPNCRLNGDQVDRLPNNINISIPGISSEMLVLYLDAQGVYVSAKSACKSTDPEVSHVLQALGMQGESTEGSIRFSLGRSTTKQDIEYVLRALKHVLKTISQ